jgi:hypothetical protein
MLMGPYNTVTGNHYIYNHGSPIGHSGAHWSKLRTTFGFSRTYNSNKVYTIRHLFLSFIGSRDESGASLTGAEGVVSIKHSLITLNLISSHSELQKTLHTQDNHYEFMNFP